MAAPVRTLAIVLTAVMFVLGCGVYAGGCGVERAQAAQLAAEEELADEWARFEPSVTADWNRWKNDPLFVSRDGGDAAPLLFAHIRWTPSDAGAPHVPRDVSEQMRSYDGGWATHADELEVQHLDLTWMRELAAAGYWDIEPPDGPFKSEPFKPYTQPTPNFVDAQNIGRVRLVQGLRAGDARKAAREVRELARLCLSTESLLGELTGLALLTTERRAHEEAVRRGHDVAGWQPYSEHDTAQIGAALWAAQAPYSLLATGALAGMRPPIGACAGLRTGLAFAGFIRAWAFDLLSDRYAALGRVLDESPCRLRRLRGFWANPSTAGQLPFDGKAVCLQPDGTRAKNCDPPRWLTSVPLVRPWVAHRVVTGRRSVNELGPYAGDGGLP